MVLLLLFYATLCFASAYSPSWFVARTWQITIISGSLLVPLFNKIVQTENGPVEVRGKILVQELFMSLVILIGIIVMQVKQSQSISTQDFLFGILPVILVSIAYPLGNSKMMEVCAGRLDGYQRVVGLTLAACLFGYCFRYMGCSAQECQEESDHTVCSVAVFSGVIATVLFLQSYKSGTCKYAKLATVEAT
ncbi:multidrug resistance efflux transporter family protein [Paenibacillus ottowii]